MIETEAILTGGRTAVSVLRIGETTRRPPTPNAAFIRALLQHLAAVGFTGVPRYLGSDDEGREVYSYIAGTVPAELGDHDDATITAAARLIRRYHDATATLFDCHHARNAGIEVACHNDLSPCNAVFRAGEPVALIDFDAAAPGSRAYDLGYASWLWLDLGDPARAASEQLRRLRVLLAAYGKGPSEAEVIRATLDRQAIVIAEGARTGRTAMHAWAAKCRDWTLKHVANAAACVC